METPHINPYQLARRWGFNPKTLQNWRSKGIGPPYIKIGRNVLYRLDEIEGYEETHHIVTNETTINKI